MPGPECPVAASYLALGQSGQHHRHRQSTRTAVDVVSAHNAAGAPHNAAHDDDTGAPVDQVRTVVLAVVVAVAVPGQVVATERLGSSGSCSEEGGGWEKGELGVG